MIAFLMAGLGRWLLLGAVVVVAIGGLYAKGHSDGRAGCELKQQQQMARMEKYVKQIRERVEQRLPDDVDGIMRPDTFQRDD